MRIVADPVAVYLWLAISIASVAAMLIVGDYRIFLIGWVAGGLIAVIFVATKARRCR
jgi:hypothetical protein